MNNALRGLQSVVSIDGWIGEFEEDGTASVHIDAVFMEGAFGDDREAKVRFKIALKRAEIVLCLVADEPLSLIKESVRRKQKPLIGREIATLTTKGIASAGVGVELGSTTPPRVSLEAGAKGSLERETERQIETELCRFLEQHFRPQKGDFAWRFEPAMDEVLSGTPFDAVEPVARVRRHGERNSMGDKPFLKVEIRCKREDIHIFGLEAKSAEVQHRFSSSKSHDLKMAAAEQIIRDELVKAGFLEIPDLSEKLATVLVADAILTEDT